MNRNLLSGAALAAVLAASPALAQQPNSTTCALNDLAEARIANERLSQLDTDRDGRITMAEYQSCLDANVAADERQRLMDEFTRFDQNRDQALILAEIQTTGGARADAGTTGQPAQVRVAEQTPNVQVTQPAPTVRVEQAPPQVAVQQPEPQVAVQQREPEVRVEQREPEVSVQQPEPTVSIEQPEAEVAIQQAQPQVEMNVPPPEVEVRQAQPQVRVEQRKPQVAVEQPEPEVRVEQAEANIEIQTEEPRVVVEQAEAEVQIERVTSPEPTVARQSAATSGDMEQEANAAGATAATTDATTAPVAATAGLPFDEIEGEEVHNVAGEEIGQISDVVMEQSTGNLFVVVSAGGVLGIGETEIVFPYDSVSMVGDRVTINTTMTQGQLEERRDYDQSLFVEVPEDRVIR